MSESIIFPSWKAGAAKTSSLTGPLRADQTRHWSPSNPEHSHRNENSKRGTLTCALCACRWQRRPCGSRDWRSWTSWCRWWCTRRSSHRSGWKNGRTLDRRTAKLRGEKKQQLSFQKDPEAPRGSGSLHVYIFKGLLLLRCTASIKGRSLGCRLSSTGVPIRSWGR